MFIQLFILTHCSLILFIFMFHFILPVQMCKLVVYLVFFRTVNNSVVLVGDIGGDVSHINKLSRVSLRSTCFRS